MKQIAVALLLLCVGCESAPKQTTWNPAAAPSLRNDQWTPKYVTLKPIVKEIQVPKYQYSCEEGYVLGWVHSGEDLYDMRSQQITYSLAVGMGPLDKKDDGLLCIYDGKVRP